MMVYAPDNANAARAALMSAAEVSRAAQLLRRDFRFQQLTDEEFADGTAISATAFIWATKLRFTGAPGAPVVDLRRDHVCQPNVHYIAPSSQHAVWHHTLNRYGAAQLNDRFRSAAVDINDQAWLGWFAVKALWEAGARNKSLTELSFDGHKGRALKFNNARELIQPLYRLSADGARVVEEVIPETAEENPCAS